MAKLIKRKQIDLKLQDVADGMFGNLNIPGVIKGDDMETAFDKIIKIIDRMSPAPAPMFGSSTHVVTESATALKATAARLLNGSAAEDSVYKYDVSKNIVWTTSGGIQTVTTGRDGHFRDGKSANAKLKVTHAIEGGATKTVTLSGLNTTALNTLRNVDDAGVNGATTYTGITLLDRVDYYNGDSTKMNFYDSLKASFSAVMSVDNPASSALRTLTFSYSEDNFSTQLTLQGTYRIESDTAPAASAALTAPAMGAKVSGVPTLNNGYNLTTGVLTSTNAQKINIAGSITNGIKFYYPAKIAESVVSGTNGNYETLSGSKTANSAHAYSQDHAVNGSVYISKEHSTKTITGSITPYDIFGAGSAADATALSNVRIDTVSLAKAATDATRRFVSPITSNEFEAISASPYNLAAHANKLGTGDYAHQLQLLNGSYIYPKGSYTDYEAGLEYDSLTGFKYADFKVTTLSTGRVNLKIDITGTGFGTSSINTPDFKLYIKVGNSVWMDANKAAEGNPITSNTNGVGCVDTGAPSTVTTSTRTTRQITFGATGIGDVLVRVGLGKNSTITISNVTFGL
jgi:hypothetical protein